MLMIWTIGTSNRTLGEFLYELERRKITCLIDVRSSPYSSRFPWFSRQQIERWTERQALMYSWQGSILGGRSDTPLDHPDYIATLERILSCAGRENVAIFCAEGDPAECHRTWSVAASLLVRHGVIAQSILRDGREEAVIDSLRRVPLASIEHCIAPAVRTAIFNASGSELLL
jgi:uncharacterized protein (DUF488 family)